MRGINIVEAAPAPKRTAPTTPWTAPWYFGRDSESENELSFSASRICADELDPFDANRVLLMFDSEEEDRCPVYLLPVDESEVQDEKAEFAVYRPVLPRLESRRGINIFPSAETRFVSRKRDVAEGDTKPDVEKRKKANVAEVEKTELLAQHPPCGSPCEESHVTSQFWKRIETAMMMKTKGLKLAADKVHKVFTIKLQRSPGTENTRETSAEETGVVEANAKVDKGVQTCARLKQPLQVSRSDNRVAGGHATALLKSRSEIVVRKSSLSTATVDLRSSRDDSDAARGRT